MRAVWLTALLCLPLAVQAQQAVQQAQQQSSELTSTAVASQRRIDQLDDAARNALEAYQIESDYGRTLEAWRGELVQADDSRVVEFLRLGRLMLFYQTLDAQEQGYWDTATQRWQPLPSGYRRTLEQGMAIARTEQVPVMLRLPLPAVTQEQTP